LGQANSFTWPPGAIRSYEQSCSFHLETPKQKSPSSFLDGLFLHLQLCGDGVGSGVEGVLDASAEDRQDGDNDEGDQGDQETVFDQGLAVFFVDEFVEHDSFLS
jgi:hypothetical protein